MNKILKQTHDVQIAETFEHIIKKMTESDNTTEKLTQFFRRPQTEEENTQTPSIRKVTGTQSLRFSLFFMKRSRKNILNY